MKSSVVLSFILFFWSFTMYGSAECRNFYYRPTGLVSNFDYSQFLSKKEQYITEIRSGKIESNFKTSEEKIAFLEALEAVHLKGLPHGWSLPKDVKFQEKMIKLLSKMDMKNLTMYQVNKIIAFAYKEKLAFFYPVRHWGKKPLAELTEEQVIARVEEEIVNYGIIDALKNLGFINDPVGFKRFMTFVNNKEGQIEVGFSSLFNVGLLHVNGLSWFTPLAIRLPDINFFDVNKKVEIDPEQARQSLVELFKEGKLTVKKDEENSNRYVRNSTYSSHYYHLVHKAQLPLFFAFLWSGIGLNMYHNYGGPEHHTIKDVVVIEIKNTRDQALRVINVIAPGAIGGKDETKK